MISPNGISMGINSDTMGIYTMGMIKSYDMNGIFVEDLARGNGDRIYDI